MIRLILALLTAIVYLIGTLPVLLILWLLGKSRPAARDRAARVMIRWVFRVLIKVSGIRVTVIGEERVPGDTAVLYTGNHRSIFDILITYVRSPRICGYVAKKELGGIPLFSLWARYINCLFFDRKDLVAEKRGVFQQTLQLFTLLYRRYPLCPKGLRLFFIPTFLQLMRSRAGPQRQRPGKKSPGP